MSAAPRAPCWSWVLRRSSLWPCAFGDRPDSDENRAPELMIGASAEWADDSFMDGMFGIGALQSQRSGLPRYSAQAGFKSVGVELGFVYPIGDRWSVMTVAEYSRADGRRFRQPDREGCQPVLRRSVRRLRVLTNSRARFRRSFLDDARPADQVPFAVLCG